MELLYLYGHLEFLVKPGRLSAFSAWAEALWDVGD